MAPLDLANTIRRASVDVAFGWLRIGQVLCHSPGHRNRFNQYAIHSDSYFWKPYSMVNQLADVPPTTTGLSARAKTDSLATGSQAGSPPTTPPILVQHMPGVLHALARCRARGRRLQTHGLTPAELYILPYCALTDSTPLWAENGRICSLFT